MEDAAFDALELRLRSINATHPYFNHVGAAPSSTDAKAKPLIQHNPRMLSLAKANVRTGSVYSNIIITIFFCSSIYLLLLLLLLLLILLQGYFGHYYINYNDDATLNIHSCINDELLPGTIDF